MTDALSAIDCDTHPSVPDLAALMPHMEPFWRDTLLDRGVDAIETASYPLKSPLTARPDWKGGARQAATSPAQFARDVFDGLGAGLAILNPLYGAQIILNEDMARVVTRALNDWTRAEWLDKDSRLRASIVLPMHNVEHAVDELERCAGDRRFVQAMVLVGSETPLGRRHFWPLYERLERLGMPLGIHAGSSYRNPVTSLGWPSYFMEDYAAQAQGFQSALASLVTEGVFARCPALKVVMLESGVTWLPPFMWRLTKFWRGLRFEVPWVDRPPMEIARDNVRLTIQPLDAPDDAEAVARLVDQFNSDDMLLYASDYPHWQFDGADAAPSGLSPALVKKIKLDNPLSTYPRLAEARP